MESLVSLEGMNEMKCYSSVYILDEIKKHPKSLGQDAANTVEDILSSNLHRFAIENLTYNDIIIELQKRQKEMNALIIYICPILKLFSKQLSEKQDEFKQLIRYLMFLKLLDILFIPTTLLINILSDLNAKSQNDAIMNTFVHKTTFAKIDSMLSDLYTISKKIDESQATEPGEFIKVEKLNEIVKSNSKSFFYFEKEWLLDSIITKIQYKPKDISEINKSSEPVIKADRMKKHLFELGNQIRQSTNYIRTKEHKYKILLQWEKQNKMLKDAESKERRVQIQIEHINRCIKHKLEDIIMFKKCLRAELKCRKSLGSFASIKLAINTAHELYKGNNDHSDPNYEDHLLFDKKI